VIALTCRKRFSPALGLIAVGRNQCTAEAFENVKGAVEQYPRARLASARLLACRGDANQAAAELHAYLESNRVENRPVVEAWLHQLAPVAELYQNPMVLSQTGNGKIGIRNSASAPDAPNEWARLLLRCSKPYQ
jgi:hypothetical protein